MVNFQFQSLIDYYQNPLLCQGIEDDHAYMWFNNRQLINFYREIQSALISSSKLEFKIAKDIWNYMYDAGTLTRNIAMHHFVQKALSQPLELKSIGRGVKKHNFQKLVQKLWLIRSQVTAIVRYLTGLRKKVSFLTASMLA